MVVSSTVERKQSQPRSLVCDTDSGPSQGMCSDVEIRHSRSTFRSSGCCGAVPMLREIAGVDVHVHVRPLATVGAGLRAVQVTPDQFGEPVRGPLRRRPGIGVPSGAGWASSDSDRAESSIRR